jgi:signal transduction histidine kinase
MTLVHLFRSRPPILGRARYVTRTPVTLHGPWLLAARLLWAGLALIGVMDWILGLAVYHHSALLLQNGDCCVTRHAAEWRTGLQSLGLSPAFYAAFLSVLHSLLGLFMAVIGILIFIRKSDEWMALVVSLTLLLFGTTATNNSAAALIEAYPGWGSLLWGFSQFPYYAFFLIPYVFPDGRFVPRWSAWIAALFALTVSREVAFGQPTAPQSAKWLAVIPVVIIFLGFGVALVAPVYRYVRVSDSGQRQQIKWVTFALVIALVAMSGASLLGNLLPWTLETPTRAVLYDLMSSALVICCFAFVPVSFAVAILRYRLWDIDLILNRALVYGTLTVSVIMLYVVIVGGLGQLLQAQGNLILSLVATGVVAVLFQPIRGRLQRAANRLMYGLRDEPYDVISGLGRKLEGTLTPNAILPTIVHTVAGALKLPYTAIELKQDGELVLAAEAGVPTGDSLRIPLIYQSDPIGELVLGYRPGETVFSSGDKQLLDNLAHQSGIAAYAVRLHGDLQRSRRQLVRAREEERRRLRRDLHDGLGPALASMAMQSEAARDWLSSDPAQTETLLVGLTEQLQAATADIRRLVHDLRPPALDDLGLMGAVRNQMSRYSARGTRMTFEAPESLPALPAAVEVAAYRIISEALNNVLRHAEAGMCHVQLSVDEGAKLLHVNVSDDGRGFQSIWQAGVGLASMRERAAELGGHCAVERGEAGGTRVRATLPLSLDGNTPVMRL